MVIQRIQRPITHTGRKTSEMGTAFLKDLCMLKKPEAIMLNKRKDIVPFDDLTQVEAFSKKHDASLFVFASHSKKRPNNVVLGRLYDGDLLDMVELGVDKLKRLTDFHGEKVPVGTKPCIIFSGPHFSTDPENVRLQNLLVDLFHREQVSCVRLQGLEHVINFTIHEDKLYMRNYRILLKKSGTRVPRVELEDMGPSVDFTIRRKKLASEDLFKLACRTPKELKAKKVKNISRDSFGTKHGRVHIKQQDIAKLTTRKMKGLKKKGKKKQ